MNLAPAITRSRADIGRMLNPKTIVIVGMKDDSPFPQFVQRTLDDSKATVYFVSPRHDTVMGRTTYKALADIPEKIDAVYAVTSAAVSVDIAEQCVELGIGGLVLIAGGFAEAGEGGLNLQGRLQAAADAGGFAVVGPNGLGIINVPSQVSLTLASDHKRRPGGISVISQSGAVLSGVAMAAWRLPSIGLNVLVSSGNEAVTDLADYIDYLADDPGTTAIGLVIEKIRRPEAFFAAAKRAILAGKPIVALKLARSARTQELAASHTGSLTGDSWVYEVAFRQLGIGMARDAEELVDRLAIIEQLDPEYWTAVENLAILTFTGGFASMSMDLATDEGINVPPLDELRGWVMENLPGVSVPNPLDTTGMGSMKWPEILDIYGKSPEIDAYLMVHPLADEDGGPAGNPLMRMFAEASATHGKPFIVSNCATELGGWANDIIDAQPGAATGYGPRATLRGIETLGQFVRARKALAAEATVPEALARPSATPIMESEGNMLPFGDAMRLLEENGIPVAPYQLITGDADVSAPSFAGPYVVKLADVAHRTEHGAVLLNIDTDGLGAAVEEMRAIARRDGLASVVAVQPMEPSRGEAFLGIQNGELGPMIVFGLGGIFVEVLKKVGGRMAPITRAQAEELITEFEDSKLMHGFRGQKPWNLAALAELLVSAGQLAAAGAGWIDSIDVNPLLVTDDGFLAVDALCLVRD